ncbi:MAG TPA: hypothetical protein VEL07_02275 [Planctomycetota bacterium]|nr:hypothetical protein [Planctomycetota bacterium]
MARWMDDHFKGEPPMKPLMKPLMKAPEPPRRRSRWAAWVIVLLALGGIAGAWAVGWIDASAIRERLAAILDEPPVAASMAPAPTSATDPAAPAAAPTVAPKGLSSLVKRVAEHREALAKHETWLRACQEQDLVGRARSAAAATAPGNRHAAEARLSNLLGEIESRQNEVRRIGRLCDKAEQNLIDRCDEAGYPVPEGAVRPAQTRSR